MTIRPATLADLALILSLDGQCVTAAHWTEQQYLQAFQGESSERLLLVAEALPLIPINSEVTAAVGADVLGFLVARHLAPEWELENIVVAPAARRKGFGKQLMGELLSAAHQTNGKAVFLEVRESNRVARTLYENAGFEQVGRRKSYYTNPMEDAVLYRRTLSGVHELK